MAGWSSSWVRPLVEELGMRIPPRLPRCASGATGWLVELGIENSDPWCVSD